MPLPDIPNREITSRAAVVRGASLDKIVVLPNAGARTCRSYGVLQGPWLLASFIVLKICSYGTNDPYEYQIGIRRQSWLRVVVQSGSVKCQRAAKFMASKVHVCGKQISCIDILVAESPH